MGLSWNSWYNPLDNASNVLGGAASLVGGAIAGGASPLPVSSLNPMIPNTGNSAVNGSVMGMESYVNPSAPSVLGTATSGATTPTPSVAPLTAPPDPYAQWGGQAAYNSLTSGFNTQKQNIFNTANEAAANAAPGYGLSVMDMIHNLRTGQQSIDQKAAQNELSKKLGLQGILGMVGRGIKSAGVMLGNKNAGSSSATGAIANAYGQLGREQSANIGNQYAQNQDQIGQDQSNFNYQLTTAPQRFHTGLMDTVNTIVNQARDKFAQLDADMANASLPERIAIEQEKEKVRSAVLGQLQQYDTQLQSGVGGIKAATPEQSIAKAQELATAGTAPTNAFNFTDQVPGQFQGTGPFASSLPIFTLGKRRVTA